MLLSVVKLLTIVFVLSLSLGQLGRLPVDVGGNIYASDVLLVVLIAVWGLWVIRNWKIVKKLQVPPLLLLGGMFAL